MNKNLWYLDDNEDYYSNYTEFASPEVTEVNMPVEYWAGEMQPDCVSGKVGSGSRSRKDDSRIRSGRKNANSRSAGINSGKSRKKRSGAGKAVLCVFGALAIAAVSITGTWFYMTEVKDSDDLKSGAVLMTGSKAVTGNIFFEEATETEESNSKEFSAKSSKKTNGRSTVDTSDPAYEVAENIMSSLWCDNDVDTAYAIFNWVHSNIFYQALNEEMTYEEAAYRGFTRRTGDCYVYFSCAKMLLDCAGIPNMMVERYPVVTNGHYWNLVQLDGEWYHCDATVFRDHPDLYFMCTDYEIGDEHHSFDSSLYPERASGYSYYTPDQAYVDPYADCYDDYYDDYYYDDYYYDDYYYDYYYGDYNGGYYVGEDANSIYAPYDDYYTGDYYSDGYYAW